MLNVNIIGLSGPYSPFSDDMFCIGFLSVSLLIHSHTQWTMHSLTHSINQLNHSLIHTLTHSLIHSLTHSLPHSLTHSLMLHNPSKNKNWIRIRNVRNK